MAEPNLNELNTATTVNIMPSIADNFFKNGPIMAYCKEDRMKIFPGGTGIQENFLYGAMNGGFFSSGDQFDTSRNQIKTGMTFTMKKAYVNVTEFLDQIEIELRSPHAAFDTVKTDLATAALTMSAILEIAIIKHGQSVGGDDRFPAFNGFEEALTNGTDLTYSGKTFPTYGGQARADVSGALNSPTGPINANIAGPINNHVLEQSYQSCVIGAEHPKLGITTSACVGYINENYAPMQRLVDTVDPVIGWQGLKFKGATIIESQYMPGTYGVNDPKLGNYLTPTGTGPAGETFLWLNPGGSGDDSFFRLHISESPLFQFGFTGFKPQIDSIQVAGQVLFGGNFIVRTPRLMRFMYGITS